MCIFGLLANRRHFDQARLANGSDWTLGFFIVVSMVFRYLYLLHILLPQVFSLVSSSVSMFTGAGHRSEGDLQGGDQRWGDLKMTHNDSMVGKCC